MPLVQTRVDVNDHFSRIDDEVAAHARRVVAIGAAVGARAAEAKGAERGMGPATVEAARPTQDGWVASFVMGGAHQWWQNYGTLGNRRKRLKSPPRTNRTREPGTGITPLGHLDAGALAGKRAIQAELARGV